MEVENYVVCSHVLLLHFLFSKLAQTPTPFFECLKIHLHTALFFCFVLFSEGIT